MDFDTYFDGLVLREGDWLRSSKGALKQYWPQVPSALDRASLELYEEVFGKPSDADLPGIDEWFYRAQRDLDNRRPIDLIATPEGLFLVRALFVRISVGAVG